MKSIRKPTIIPIKTRNNASNKLAKNSSKGDIQEGQNIGESHTSYTKELDETNITPMENREISKRTKEVFLAGEIYIKPIRLRTNTIQNCRKSTAKIVRLASAGMMDLERAGKLCYLLQSLTAAFRVEAELSVVDEVRKMKKEIANLTRVNNETF